MLRSPRWANSSMVFMFIFDLATLHDDRGDMKA